MKLKTGYEPPPIPDRRWDWYCYDEENYEGGMPIGHGATEDEAIIDFYIRMELDGYETGSHR